MGVPEIAPVFALSDSPAGRLPAVTDHKRAPVPPLDCSVALKEVPTIPPGSKVEEMAGAGSTVTIAEAETVFFATDVATTITLRAEETFAGPWYVAPVLDVLVSVPQVLPLQPLPARLQDTP